MKKYTCTECHQPIETGMAVLRSISFQRVAFHKVPCYTAQIAAADHTEVGTFTAPVGARRPVGAGSTV